MPNAAEVSPIQYESTCEDNEYGSFKTEITLVDNDKKKVNYKQWKADHGLEGLLYCYDHMKQQVVNHFEAEHWIEHFPHMLAHTERGSWENIWNPIAAANADPTMQHFEEAFNRFLVKCCNAVEHPRDNIIAYMRTSACKKPRKVSVQAHVNRMNAIASMAKLLPGREAPLTPTALSTIILNSFPDQWITDFIQARTTNNQQGDYDLDTVVRYMSIKKYNEDKKSIDTSNTRNTRSRTGGRGNGGRNNGNRNAGNRNHHNSNRSCPAHPTANHSWADCSVNPQSPNYHMNPTSPFFGRAPGRGGRGGRQGRGNTHAGRGNGGSFSGRGRGNYGGRGNPSNSYGRGDQHYQQFRQHNYYQSAPTHGRGAWQDNYFQSAPTYGRGAWQPSGAPDPQSRAGSDQYYGFGRAPYNPNEHYHTQWNSPGGDWF